ncbi:hypothetical protein CKK34_2403 [Yarrowia sp. E02]|nr:hypothetical protein CKK34_2403 [Yarrowia sp. E02]
MARKSTPEPEMRRKTRVKANILHVTKEGIFDSAGTRPGSQEEERQQQQQTQTQSPMAKLKQMALRNQQQQPQPQPLSQSQQGLSQTLQSQQKPQSQQPQQTLTTRLYLQNKSLARQNSNLNTKMSALEHHLSELISENICLRQKNLELQRSHDNWLKSHVSQKLKKQLQQHINGINQLMQGLVGEVEEHSEQRAHESASQEHFEMSVSRSLSKTPDSRALSRGSPASGRNSLSRSRQTMGPGDFSASRRRSSRRRSSFFGDGPLLQDPADVMDPSAEQLHLEARDVVTPMVDDAEGWGEVPADEVHAHMEEMERERRAQEEEAMMEVDGGEEENEMEVNGGSTEKVHFSEQVEEHYDEPMEMVSQETSFPSPVHETSFPSPVRETVQETSFPSPEHESFPSLIQETSFPSPVKEQKATSFASPVKEKASFASPAQRMSFASPIDESSFPSPFSTSFRRVTSAPRGEPMEEVTTDGESSFAFIQQRSRPGSRPGSRNKSSRPGSREKQIRVFADPVSPAPAKEASLEDSAPLESVHVSKPAAVSSTPPRSRPSLFDTPESTKERENERKRRESMEQVVEQPESPCSRPSSRRSSRRVSAQKDQVAEEAVEETVKQPEEEMEEEKPVVPKVEQRAPRSRRASAKPVNYAPVESPEKPVSGLFEKGLEKLQSLGSNVTARKSRAPTATGGVKVTTSRKSTKAAAVKPSKTSALMQKDANGSNGNGAGAKGKVETVKTAKLTEKPVKPAKVVSEAKAIKLETPEPRSRRSRGAPVNYKLPSVGSKLRRDTDGFVDAVGGLKRSLSACDENGMKRRRI